MWHIGHMPPRTGIARARPIEPVVKGHLPGREIKAHCVPAAQGDHIARSLPGTGHQPQRSFGALAEPIQFIGHLETVNECQGLAPLIPIKHPMALGTISAPVFKCGLVKVAAQAAESHHPTAAGLGQTSGEQ